MKYGVRVYKWILLLHKMYIVITYNQRNHTDMGVLLNLFITHIKWCISVLWLAIWLNVLQDVQSFHSPIYTFKDVTLLVDIYEWTSLVTHAL